MSISFYASRAESRDGRTYILQAFACDCAERWCDACDTCSPDEDYPQEFTCEVCENDLNLANANALNLLSWLGLERDWCGTVEAGDLAARCARRLWDERRNLDTGRAPVEYRGTNGCRVIECGRPDGYLRERAERLLRIAERAKAHGFQVSWA